MRERWLLGGALALGAIGAGLYIGVQLCVVALVQGRGNTYVWQCLLWYGLMSFSAFGFAFNFGLERWQGGGRKKWIAWQETRRGRR